MYIKNTTMLLIAALCFISCVYAQDKCYVPLDNGPLGTSFYVQGETFPPPYACSRTSTAVGFAAPSTYTFSAAETSCGEMVSIPEVSFGRYECELIPAGVPGTVTTCMVASSTRTNFEGVYVKFFGNETSRVFTGYFAGGRSYPTGSLVVDFKTTDKAHKYGFEYTSGYIKWYIDNREVTSAYGGKPLPTTANRFYASLTTEKTGVYTDDSVIPTDSSVDRVFTGLESAVATFTNMSYAPVLFVACDKETGYLPGDSGWKPYDPSQCDTRDRVVVFDDALAKDWTNTDSTDSSFGDTSVPIRTGTKSISWFLTPMTARLYFLFPATFLSSDYDNFQFWINGNGVFGQQIGIKMIFDDGSTSPEVKINDALDEGVQPYDWSRAVFSFTMFGLTTNARNVKGFVLSSMSIVYGGKIAIDDVSLGYTLPICANKVESIYADGPADDFSTDMSWGKMEIKSNKVVHGGNYAVQWNLYENGGLRFNTKKKIVVADKYPGIAFWLNPAELRGQDWTVSVTSPDSTGENNVAGIPLNLFKYYGGPLPQQGTWIRVAIPFYDFGVTDKKARIDGVLFKTSNTYQGTLYIDDIDFISPEQPSSAALLGAGLFGIVASLAVLLL